MHRSSTTARADRSSFFLTAVAAAATALALGACVSAAGSSGAPSSGGSADVSVPPSSASSLPSSGPASGGIEHPTGARDLVIRYEATGGFVAPQALLSRYPVVSVYGDGTVINEGPITMIYPGPALPNLRVWKISEAGLQRLLSLATEAGLLGPDASYDATGIADVTTDQFTVVAGGSRHVITAYALGMQDRDSSLDPSVAAARVKLRTFAAALTDLETTLAGDAVSLNSTYQYSEIRIYVTPGAPAAGDPAVSRKPFAWPLSTPLATFGSPVQGPLNGSRCGTVSGADLETLRPLLDQATQITGWTSGGKTYTLLVLPLLPDETGCPAAS